MLRAVSRMAVLKIGKRQMQSLTSCCKTVGCLSYLGPQGHDARKTVRHAGGGRAAGAGGVGTTAIENQYENKNKIKKYVHEVQGLFLYVYLQMLRAQEGTV